MCSSDLRRGTGSVLAGALGQRATTATASSWGAQRLMSSHTRTTPWVSVDELRRVLAEPKAHSKERVVLVDTRGAEAYDKGHLDGAVRIEECFTHLATSDPAGLASLEATFRDLFGRRAGITGAANERVVIYEEGLTSGFAQSCRGYFLLKWLGHPNVSVLQGGLAAWRNAGGELSQQAPQVTPAQLKTQVDASLMATKDDVLQALKDKSKDAVLLDVRDQDEWIGTSSSPYGKDFCPRKGRLPGAKWLEWYKLHDRKDGVAYTKPVDEVKATLTDMGIKPEQDVIVYCFKGSRASNTLMQLRHAGFKATNYFGSWNEWSRDDSLPIESSLLSTPHA